MENFPHRIVVIAPNKMQYGYFLSQQHLSFSGQGPYMYVGSEFDGCHRLRGHRELDFLCVGEWKKRRDIDEIFQTIEMCNIGTRLEGRARVFKLLYL